MAGGKREKFFSSIGPPDIKKWYHLEETDSKIGDKDNKEIDTIRSLKETCGLLAREVEHMREQLREQNTTFQ